MGSVLLAALKEKTSYGPLRERRAYGRTCRLWSASCRQVDFVARRCSRRFKVQAGYTFDGDLVVAWLFGTFGLGRRIRVYKSEASLRIAHQPHSFTPRARFRMVARQMSRILIPQSGAAPYFAKQGPLPGLQWPKVNNAPVAKRRNRSKTSALSRRSTLHSIAPHRRRKRSKAQDGAGAKRRERESNISAERPAPETSAGFPLRRTMRGGSCTWPLKRCSKTPPGADMNICVSHPAEPQYGVSPRH